MDVLIFGGQSNMQGQSESLPDEPAVEGGWEYLYSTDAIRPLCHPVGEDFGELLLAAAYGHGCLVPSFVRAYTEETGKQAVAVHAAKGATVIADWQDGSERYLFALKKIKAAINKVGKPERVYYIWLQGESDALSATSERSYCTALEDYARALRRDAAIDLFGIIEVGYFAKYVFNNPAADEEIMRAQEKTGEKEGFALLSRLGPRLSLDEKFLNPFAEGHFNNAALSALGRDAGKTLGIIRKNSSAE